MIISASLSAVTIVTNARIALYSRLPISREYSIRKALQNYGLVRSQSLRSSASSTNAYYNYASSFRDRVARGRSSSISYSSELSLFSSYLVGMVSNSSKRRYIGRSSTIGIIAIRSRASIALRSIISRASVRGGVRVRVDQPAIGMSLSLRKLLIISVLRLIGNSTRLLGAIQKDLLSLLVFLLIQSVVTIFTSVPLGAVTLRSLGSIK